ncbi:probable leucine-rich repeat receptor-like protein kinase At5g63930 [Hibiscus syriacus]|uniref:probable leucine-rich repeat receptor-like protein kinase At5g63930 n=1 Tax=Hibiscus syriacus TaxID=106335 RepID=UPI001924B1B1|nr:probable leucine-rich repeat receptor-like protein kinase At5g63930 [Hibiscus syriacus]
MANILSFFVSISVTIFVPLCMAATSFNDDQSVLLEFKAHIASNPHNVWPYNWSSATGVCIWTGVSSGVSGRVMALNLPNMILHGDIPPPLGNLSFLLALNVSGNCFNGDLPSELAKLHGLELMDSSNNELSGEIPSWFGNLTELRHLSLFGNNFIGSGSILSSIGNLTNLRELYLAATDIAGEIPREIGNLRDFQVFDARNSSLTGSIPENIFNMSSLKWIYLGNNKLSGTLPIDIRCNQRNPMGGRQPSELGGAGHRRNGAHRSHSTGYLQHVFFEDDSPRKQ